MKKPKKKVSVALPPMPIAVMPETIAGKVAALQVLEQSEGWMIIRQVLLDNLAALDQCIITKFEGEEALTDAEVDACREKRMLNKSLLETPARYMAILKATEAPPHDFDPYEHTEDEDGEM